MAPDRKKIQSINSIMESHRALFYLPPYMKPLDKVIRRFRLPYRYAAYIRLYLVSTHNPKQAVEILNRHVGEITEWLGSKSLQFNPD